MDDACLWEFVRNQMAIGAVEVDGKETTCPATKPGADTGITTANGSFKVKFLARCGLVLDSYGFGRTLHDTCLIEWV